ncbi:MAG: HemK2/MTQ2 family protein methyltransferase [Candidatus Odinarchaeia archaeon]
MYTYKYKTYVFKIYPEVYFPSEDTIMLAENLEIDDKDKVLELGSGSGLITVVLAEKASRVIAVDVQPKAAENTLLNVSLNGFRDKVEVLIGDLFYSLSEREMFDALVFNPPYLPLSEEEIKGGWVDLSCSGGVDGRALIDPFIQNAYKYLKNDGKVFLIQSSLSDVNKTLSTLRDSGFNVKIVSRKKFFFEEIVVIYGRKTGG